ncbi:MAG TPA: hypothetical protein D7H97_01650, partial [Candidatus Poseidoniales archaeon]
MKEFERETTNFVAFLMLVRDCVVPQFKSLRAIPIYTIASMKITTVSEAPTHGMFVEFDEELV